MTIEQSKQGNGFCFCVKRGYLSNFTQAMLSSFGVGLIAVAVSTPINLYFQSGHTGNVWGDALFDMMQWYNYPRTLSAFMGEAIVDIFDKQICVALVFLIIRLAAKWKKSGSKVPPAAVKAVVLAAVSGAAVSLLLPVNADAANESSGIFEYYKEQIYDSSKGMSVSEANAIEETSDGYIWFGSYAGLIRYDSNTFEFIPEDGVASVTAMTTSSDGTLWIGTNDSGLMKYKNGEFTSFSKADGLPVNSVRSFAECEDGTMYIGTTDRICKMTGDGSISVLDADITYVNSLLFYDGVLIGVSNDGSLFSISDEQTVQYAPNPESGNYYTCIAETSQGLMAGTSGNEVVLLELKNEQILCLLDAGDGSFYAGTDGAGIYRIRDGQIEENITMEQGLTSDIVLRMLSYEDGFFIVASNALQYYDGMAIQRIENFPYFNNYDILIKDDTAYIISSCGIYETKAADLLTGEPFAYKLYNNADGLSEGLTSNAWNRFDTDGAFLLCTNSGLIRWDRTETSRKVEYRLGVTEVRGDGKLIEAQDGIYVIPAEVQRISVRASVRNYALSNVKVRFFIDDIAVNNDIVSQDDMQTIQVNNLSSGSYTIHLQIMSSDESQILQEDTYVIQKEAHFWETAGYKVYLVIMALWIVIFITWVCMTVYNLYRNRKLLEVRKRELEDTVDRQTQAIRGQAARMERFQWDVIESMASLIESRDGNTGEHVLRTRDYVSVLVKELQKRGMYSESITPEFVEDIIHLAPLHDVGKIKIPDAVLNKPGKLTEEEYATMKLHTVYGGEIIGNILGENATPHMVQIARELATYHHERPDGKGYPEGLKGEEIPLAARIMAIADVFDAVTSDRVYRKGRSFEEAFRVLQENAGTQFDAQLVEVFLETKDQVLKLRKEK